MQVKKFEAKTMKEALEMVKNQLGPDAIILGARDNNRGFGLLGKASVEVTAAISETSLQKKKFAESRLRDQEKSRFKSAPARLQKQFIERSVDRFIEAVPPSPRPRTTTQYIDIDDEDNMSPAPRETQAAGQRVDDLLKKIDKNQNFVIDERHDSRRRIQAAALSAANAFKSTVQDVRPPPPRPAPPQKPARAAGASAASASGGIGSAPATAEVRKLQAELEGLKKTMSQIAETPRAAVGVHPGADYGLPYDLSFMFERLVSAGIASDLVAEILKKAQSELPVAQQKNRHFVEAWVANYILKDVDVVGEPSAGRVHMFVGSSGQGKTTALVKFAGQLVIQKRLKVALLTTDTFKVGAADQIKIFAQILNAPFGIIRNQADWQHYLEEFKDMDVILVDSPGTSLKSGEETQMLVQLMPPIEARAQIHYVQSVCMKDADAIEMGRRYQIARYQDVVFTNLDESVNHGLIYNFQKTFRVPLHTFGIGPRIPDDLEPATRERVLDLIFKITKT